MNEEAQQWWRNPSGIIAAVTVMTLVLGFFYAREKQLWEDKMAIAGLEERGKAAIMRFEVELEKVRVQLGSMQQTLWELDKRIEAREWKKSKEGEPPY